MKRSAGVIPYKIENNELKVFLEHPGGPFWEGIDKWSMSKGEYKKEKAIDAAIREFNEESGFLLNKEELIFIGGNKQKSGKLVNCFIINVDLDPVFMKSNTFKKEWPLGSGIIKEFPEMDKACWFEINEARQKIFNGQIIFLNKLEEYVNKNNNF